MNRDLSEMTLQELWALFPIFLVPHDDRWATQYAEIESRIADALRGLPVDRISHIGSTAIPGIWSKNIVDALVEIPADSDITAAADALKGSGFTRMSEAARRVSFNRGYTKDGFADRVFHVHLRYAGDNDELYFRDYLIEHPPVAREYEAMKLRLWKRYAHNRNAYTDAKTDFIRKWTAIAREAYKGRYP